MKVLIIEDDADVASAVTRLLERDGLIVDVASTAQEGETLAFVNEYDVIMLDLGLPDGSGLQVVQALRRGDRRIPLMVLTGGGSELTVRALDAGADDYVTKPFEADQLRARVRALVRRGGAKRLDLPRIGNVVLNRAKHQILVDGAELHLTSREVSLLEYLIVHAGEVVSRTTLLEKVWETNFDPGTNVVDVRVSRLRKKMDDAAATAVIETRRGIGFVLMDTSANTRNGIPAGSF